MPWLARVVRNAVARHGPQRKPPRRCEPRRRTRRQVDRYSESNASIVSTPGAETIRRFSHAAVDIHSTATPDPDMAIQSPCVDVCRIDDNSGVCVGCLRTREEIREWKGMTDHRRHEIIGECARRAAQLPAITTPAPQTSAPRTS
jgi:hypothetical protein